MGGFNIIFPQALGGENCECLGSVKCKIHSLPQVPALGNPVCNAWKFGKSDGPIGCKTRKVNFETPTKPAEQLGQLISAERTSIRIRICFVRWFDRKTSTNIPSGAVIAMPLPSTWVFGGSASWRVMFEVPWWNKLQNVLFCWSRLKLPRILKVPGRKYFTSSEAGKIREFSNALNWRLQNRQNRIVKIMKLQRGGQEFNGSNKKEKNSEAFWAFFSLASLSFFVRVLSNLMHWLDTCCSHPPFDLKGLFVVWPLLRMLPNRSSEWTASNLQKRRGELRTFRWANSCVM